MLFRTRPNRPELEATKVPTAIDIAWAAGIYEGEGCARLCGRGKRSLAAHVAQKDPQMLYWLRDMFGGSVCQTRTSARFYLHNWHICGDRARIFLALIYRYMTDRRKAQIDATNALDFLSGMDMATITQEVICTRLALHYEAHFKTTEMYPDGRRAGARRRYATDEDVRNKAKAWAAKQRAKRTPEDRVKINATARKRYAEKRAEQQPKVVAIA